MSTNAKSKDKNEFKFLKRFIDTNDLENEDEDSEKLSELKIKLNRLSERMEEEVDNEVPKSVVDSIIKTYFDKNSRSNGTAITRVGAGLFQV